MNSTEQKNPQVYFKQLDVFRFLAAFAIVFYHIYDKGTGYFGKPAFMLRSDGSLNRPGLWMDTAIHNLWIGVDLFFLISGFLITYLLLQERQLNEKINIKKFYVRRILRIWPLYYLILSTGPLMAMAYGEASPNYLKHALFLGNFDLINVGWISPSVSHLWSICIEEHFYLFWPLLLYFIPNKRLPVFFMLVILISFLFKTYVLYNSDKAWMTLFLHTLSRCDILAIGALLGYYYYKKPFVLNVPLGVRLVVYFIGLFLFCNDTLALWDSLFPTIIKRYFYVGILGFWMFNYMFNPNAKFVLKDGIIHYFGRISYGIYMFHPVIIVIIIHALKKAGHPSIYLLLIITVLLTLGIAACSFEFFEKPFLKLKNRFNVLK